MTNDRPRGKNNSILGVCLSPNGYGNFWKNRRILGRKKGS